MHLLEYDRSEGQFSTSNYCEVKQGFPSQCLASTFHIEQLLKTHWIIKSIGVVLLLFWGKSQRIWDSLYTLIKNVIWNHPLSFWYFLLLELILTRTIDYIFLFKHVIGILDSWVDFTYCSPFTRCQVTVHRGGLISICKRLIFYNFYNWN